MILSKSKIVDFYNIHFFKIISYGKFFYVIVTVHASYQTKPTTLQYKKKTWKRIIKPGKSMGFQDASNWHFKT